MSELEKSFVPVLKQIWQPAFFGYLFFTAREGYISNPNSPLIPTGPGNPPPPPPPGSSTVTFTITRNSATFTGTGFLTVDGVNHVTTGTGVYSTNYTIGQALMVSFTGLGITCTPTNTVSYTVLNQPTQSVEINIPC